MTKKSEKELPRRSGETIGDIRLRAVDERIFWRKYPKEYPKVRKTVSKIFYDVEEGEDHSLDKRQDMWYTYNRKKLDREGHYLSSLVRKSKVICKPAYHLTMEATLR
ncbi:hypothetical protein J6590_084157 [Homalodisca vitripennis]|nr:hypothetical protein J6590_084157 [Homalodisca vitripennis]